MTVYSLLMNVVPYVILLSVFAVALYLDLAVFHRKKHVVELKEALKGAGIWVMLAMTFNVFVFFLYEHGWFGAGMGDHEAHSGRAAASLFLTGYLVELSLSLDNLFVIAVIFTFFRVPRHLQHTVLFWGIMGAIVMRIVMIMTGLALINAFHWIIYVFGIFLFFAAWKLVTSNEDSIDPEKSFAVRIARKLYPVTTRMEDERFFVKLDSVRHATPMFLALIAVESADLLFAVDSIPAIFAITKDPFIVTSSNLFAILGLRQMFFALSSLTNTFKYLKYSLAALLALVGVKMLISDLVKVKPEVALGTITSVLAIGIIASIISDKRQAESNQA